MHVETIIKFTCTDVHSTLQYYLQVYTVCYQVYILEQTNAGATELK